MVIIGFPGGSVAKSLPTNVTDARSISAGDAGLTPGWEHPLEKEMAKSNSFEVLLTSS